MAEPMDKIEVRANHEAGHAVVAHLMGWPIAEVKIGETGKDPSYCKLEHDPDPDIDDDAHIRRFICFYSGSIAANRHLLKPELPDYWTYCRLGWRADIIECHGFAKMVAKNKGVPTDQVIAEEEDRVQSMIDSHWHAVTALSSALLERRLIDGKEAHDIIATA